MEIGSFIELQLPKGKEFYKGNNNIARLNTGRSAIVHAYRLLENKTIWVPIYQCDSVREALKKENADIRYYHIDSKFNPVDLPDYSDDTIMFVNYYGIMSNQRMTQLSEKYSNSIIDNCQAFYCKPITDKMNVYSCRKFVGVPDGAYVIGPNAQFGVEGYPQCFSSDTATFLLSRIEYGCEGKGYAMRKLNEDRIDSEAIMKMSKLTSSILDATDYNEIRLRRRFNFQYMHSQLEKINKIDPTAYYDNSTVPMVYPLVVEDDNLIERLQEGKHFQGHWWSYICDEQPNDYFEHWLSRYVIPITIDQRYGRKEMDYLVSIIKTNLH